MKKCIVCKKEFIEVEPSDYLESLCNQADWYGIKSLMENQQHFVEGWICSETCYDTLEENL
jgi:hypothetical protein